MKPTGKETSLLRSNLVGYALIFPALLVIVGIGVVPIAQTLLYSFQHVVMTDPGNRYWAGLANYAALLDPSTFVGAKFYNELKNTLIFTLLSISLELVTGFAGALLMNREGPLRWLIRTFVLIPWVIPGIVIAQMFSFLFNDQLGVVNQILQSTGLLHTNVVWLANKQTAMFAVVLADT